MSEFKTEYERNLFQGRYARAGWETCWNDVFRRTSEYVTDDLDRQEAYYKLMSDGYFLPSSPQLWNFGVPGEKCGSSCFIGRISDTLNGIWEADATARDVYKASGGIGFNLSELRPRGATIGNSPNPAVGVMAVAKRLNDTTGYITAGGRARGALMLQLDVRHPDIIEFIFAKRPIPRGNSSELDLPLTQCNMSIRIPDEFMWSVNNADSPWTLIWSNHVLNDKNPKQEYRIDTWEQLKSNYEEAAKVFGNLEFAYFYRETLEPGLRHLSGKITVKQVWNLIVENAWHHADPGIVFTDTYELTNPNPQLGKRASNPCSEFTNVPGTSCDLGSLVLPQFIYPHTTISDVELDWDQLEDTTKLAVEYLNDAIDTNIAPVEYINDTSKQVRSIGLGIMGLHDTLILLSLPYDSQEARNLASQIMAVITVKGWETSFQLAANNSHRQAKAWNQEAMLSIFDLYEKRCLAMVHSDNTNKNIWLRLADRYQTLYAITERGHIAANTTITSVAPTGSIAQIAGFIQGHQGVSSGIEPIFDWEYTRQDHNGTTKIQHWTKPYTEDQEPRMMKTANDILPADHIRMQGAVARFTSMSVSKTINLPETCSIEQFDAGYRMAFSEKIMGTACYRDNSKPFQVLSRSGNTKPQATVLQDVTERPEALPGHTHRVGLVTADGEHRNIYVTINESNDRPYEVFFSGVKTSNSPDDDAVVSRELDTVARLVSTSLRYGVPISEVVDQLEKINGQHLFSLPSRLAKLLTKYIELDPEGGATFYCKSCGKSTRHIMTDGCKQCTVCGASAC